MVKFDGLKVFSATLYQDRAVLGEKITEWIAANRETFQVVSFEVHQSSDDGFHCLTIIVYYRRRVAAMLRQPRAAAGGAKG